VGQLANMCSLILKVAEPAKAFGAGDQSMSNGPVPLGTIDRSGVGRRFGSQFCLFSSSSKKGELPSNLSSLTGRSRCFAHEPGTKVLGYFRKIQETTE
jgi:hypothetical protein